MYCRVSALSYTSNTKTVLHADIFWYHFSGMGTQENVPKKVLVTVFPYMFHVKPNEI